MRLLDTLSRSLTEMGELGARLGGRQGEELHERCVRACCRCRRAGHTTSRRCGGVRVEGVRGLEDTEVEAAVETYWLQVTRLFRTLESLQVTLTSCRHLPTSSH